MPENVVPFDEIGNELQISTQQSELPKVVLEGGEDVVLFRRWFFDYLDRLDFVQAANLGVGAGCTAVATAVERLRDAGVRAFGLSDRDSLFKEADWATLFATDETAFSASTETELVAVNQLWEVEAYLLAPELIPGWVRSHHRHAPASQADVDAALARAVDECENLLRAQPWLTTAHRCGEGVSDGKYSECPGQLFAGHCAAELDALEDADGTAALVQAHVADVLAMAPSNRADRLRWLLRYVDTKRLMLRLKHRLQLVAARHKWVLAEFMEMRGIRPAELEHRVESLSLLLNS